MGACALAVGAKAAKLPQDAGWLSMLGIACLAGIGFTMSLFIGTLAFASSDTLAEIRLGIIVGSLISVLAGYSVLKFVGSKIE
jgi:NhaA family Na+:H+ antiporter